MLTDVQPTSIAAYHALASKEYQVERIARYILSETKPARWAWIGKVACVLRMEKSTVSARMNELRKTGIVLDGQKYRMVQMGLVQYQPTPMRKVTVQAWALVLDQPASNGVQIQISF